MWRQESQQLNCNHRPLHWLKSSIACCHKLPINQSHSCGSMHSGIWNVVRGTRVGRNEHQNGGDCWSAGIFTTSPGFAENGAKKRKYPMSCRLFGEHRKATGTQITTRYDQDLGNSISKCTTPLTSDLWPGEGPVKCIFPSTVTLRDESVWCAKPMTPLSASQLLQQQQLCPRTGGHRPHKIGVTPPTQRQTMERVSGMTSRCPRTKTVRAGLQFPLRTHTWTVPLTHRSVCVSWADAPAAPRQPREARWASDVTAPLLEKHMSHGWKKWKKKTLSGWRCCAACPSTPHFSTFVLKRRVAAALIQCSLCMVVLFNICLCNFS